MLKEQALNTFWNSFGLPAYDENTIPDDVQMPYITYEVQTGRLEDRILLTADLWYRSQSWSEITQKATEIGRAIVEMTPPTIKFDAGRLYLYLASPYLRRGGEPDDPGIRRITLEVQAEFLSNY